MTAAEPIHLLNPVMLVDMKITIGLGVNLCELAAVSGVARKTDLRLERKSWTTTAASNAWNWSKR
jgi:hypothetical protein